MVFWSPESPFSAFFCVCEVPRPPTGCRYLSLIVLGANKKSRCRCLHFITHIHTPKKMASFTATVRICVRFLQYTREMYLARFAFVYARARADVFFFFLSRVNLQPTWVLIPLREWQKSIAFLVTTAKTEDAKLTFKIISSRRNRPPNSRSSRLFPANSRTAPSPRYALSERFESFFCTTRKAATTRREGERTRD